MCPYDFNENFLRQLIHKLSQENQTNIYIAGDFNFNLINSNNSQETHDFFDLFMSNFFLPTILLPTKINNGPDTLIDNIFTNQYNPYKWKPYSINIRLSSIFLYFSKI